MVADIGSDHGYLPVWLVLAGRCPRAIATDASAESLETTGRTVRAYGLSAKIDLRLGDGLGVIFPGETSSIVIAGMGGLTIASILARDAEIARRQRLLVLQPMSEQGSLRKWARDNGFAISAEDLAQEGERFYQVICLDPSAPVAGLGETGIPDEIQMEIGPALLRGPHPLLEPMIRGKIRECDGILVRMRATMPQSDPRVRSWLERKERLEGVLRCLLR